MLKLAVAPEPNPNQNGGVDPIVLGERVRTLRLKRKWTQKQLAKAAHVTENTVRGLERGTLATRRPKFEAIALALDTTTDLLQRTDQPIAEGHPLLDGLNDDDLRMAQAYSRARTSTRLRVEKLLLANNDAGLAILERILALDDDRRQRLLAALEQSERAIEKERDLLLKRKPPTP
jgi:transcriptional regulator with XRE-family HTH domain